MAKDKNSKGVSLAKGPVLIIGLVLLVIGALALIIGGATSFTAKPIDGMVNGKKFLGLELNGWSSLLFIGAGALLVFGSPLHWGAKGMSILVAVVLGAAAVLAFLNKDTALGIFAANGLTELVWVVAAVLLLLLALLPRVGGKGNDDSRRDDRAQRHERERPPVERERVIEREVVREPRGSNGGPRGDDDVLPPMSRTTPESRARAHREREREG